MKTEWYFHIIQLLSFPFSSSTQDIRISFANWRIFHFWMRRTKFNKTNNGMKGWRLWSWAQRKRRRTQKVYFLILFMCVLCAPVVRAYCNIFGNKNRSLFYCYFAPCANEWMRACVCVRRKQCLQWKYEWNAYEHFENIFFVRLDLRHLIPARLNHSDCSIVCDTNTRANINIQASMSVKWFVSWICYEVGSDSHF